MSTNLAHEKKAKQCAAEEEKKFSNRIYGSFHRSGPGSTPDPHNTSWVICKTYL